MSDHPERTTRRDLPRYLLDLLDEEDRQRVEAGFAESGTLQETLDRIRESARSLAEDGEDHLPEDSMRDLLDGAVPAGTRDGVMGHLMACRDCRFVLSVLLAERELASAASPPRRGARPFRRGPAGWPRLALAAAAGVAVGALGLGLAGPRDPIGIAPAIRLDTARSEEADVAADLSGASDITFVIETIFPAPDARWRLTREGGGEVASGSLRFPPASPAMRTLALRIPRGRIDPGAHLLVLTSSDGTLERQWRVRVSP